MVTETALLRWIIALPALGVLFHVFVGRRATGAVKLVGPGVVAAAFAVGTFGVLARRNAIAMLMSIELMLNAVNLAIVAFGAFVPELAANGAVIALFVMAVAAGEATVGLAIVIAIYRNRRTPLVDEYSSMRE